MRLMCRSAACTMDDTVEAAWTSDSAAMQLAWKLAGVGQTPELIVSMWALIPADGSRRFPAIWIAPAILPLV